MTLAKMPAEIQINAWCGQPASGRLAATAKVWLLQGQLEDRRHLAPPPPADLRQWWDPRVGWGIILPEVEGVAPGTPDHGEGADASILRLLQARAERLKIPAVPIFRYIKDWEYRSVLLHSRARQKDLSINGSSFGIKDDEVPYYLLICGSPKDVPWDFQYLLNTTHAVGRLDLEKEALGRYVNNLLTDWAAEPGQPRAEPGRAVVWAVNYGGADITALMRDAIAVPVQKALASDNQIQVDFLDGPTATGEALIQRLAASRPGLVVTTSHGMTGPLGKENQELMRAQLGVPVDRDFRVMSLAELTGQWAPAGAIWYAHACCSAGADARTSYAELVEAGSLAAQALAGVADLGAMVAPLPRALLGAPRSLRAFIGHVEPTFDWTLRQQETGQSLGRPLQLALYDDLYSGYPVGHALRRWYNRLGSLLESHQQALRDFKDGKDSKGILLNCLLSAQDVIGTVILGDPVVSLPPLM